VAEALADCTEDRIGAAASGRSGWRGRAAGLGFSVLAGRTRALGFTRFGVTTCAGGGGGLMTVGGGGGGGGGGGCGAGGGGGAGGGTGGGTGGGSGSGSVAGPATALPVAPAIVTPAASPRSAMTRNTASQILEEILVCPSAPPRTSIVGPRRSSQMRMRGLEPPRACAHTALNRARLPIPPHPLGEHSVPTASGRYA
jgi:hypothetical protein